MTESHVIRDGDVDQEDSAGSTRLDTTPGPGRPGFGRLLVRGLWRPLLVVLLIATIVIIARPMELVNNLGELREWIRSHGVVGMLLFLAIYVVAAVALVPQALLKVAAGGLYGSVLGVVAASIGSTLGATACFLIARYVAKGSLVQSLKQGRNFSRLDMLTRKHGAVIVALTRLVPILPGNVVNYAFGLTQVRLGTFVFWSWLGMLPGTVVLVVGTDAFVRGMAESRIPWGPLIVVIAAFALLIGAFLFAHRKFRGRPSSDEPAFADL